MVASIKRHWRLDATTLHRFDITLEDVHRRTSSGSNTDRKLSRLPDSRGGGRHMTAALKETHISLAHLQDIRSCLSATATPLIHRFISFFFSYVAFSSSATRESTFTIVLSFLSTTVPFKGCKERRHSLLLLLSIESRYFDPTPTGA